MPQPSSPPAPTTPQAGLSALRIATVSGIPIRLHFTFLLFLVWVYVSSPAQAKIVSVLFVLAIFACVVLHELGHSIVALRYGIPVADITLYPIGGVARIEKRPTASQELRIAVAGPAVNVVIAVLLFGVMAAIGTFPDVDLLDTPGKPLPSFLMKLLAANVWLVLFNLLPAFPMDGGRVLRATLALHMPPEKATAIAANIGQAAAIAAGLYATFSGQWLFLFIAFFVYIGAGQEAFAYKQAALMEGVRVRQAMMTDVRTLTVGNTLKEAADVLLDTAQHDFPVVHGGQVQGVLTRDGLLRGLANGGPGAFVAGTMSREFASAGPDDDLAESLPALQSRPGPLLVLDPAEEGKLLGIVTTENVQEFFAVRQVVAAREGGNEGARDRR